MRNIFLTSLLFLAVSATGQQKEGPVFSCRTYYKPDGIYALFSTNKGTFRVSLDYKRAPMTVANFIGLTEGTITNKAFPAGVPFFSGSIWHRVVPGHVIQGGEPKTVKDPANVEGSSTGYEIPNEISNLSHDKAGMLGMANDGPNTNTCEYYITLGDRSYLDGNYTLFGEVFEGMDVVNKITQGDTTFSVSIERKGDEAGTFIVNDETFKKLVDAQWKRVKDEKELKKQREEKFIAENWPGLVSLPDGLRYKIITPGGKGKLMEKASLLKVRYTGQLMNGTTFAGTEAEGKPESGVAPVVFTCKPDDDKIIKGLQEALGQMKPGEKRLLVVPPALAYGENHGFYGKFIAGKRRFVISPGETLIMEVTLVGAEQQ